MEQITLSVSEVFGWPIGVSALVAVCVGALWSIYFNRIKEGQKAEFQKQIETQKAEFSKELEYLKAKNDKLNYITKTQFDAEFKMYKELSKSTYKVKILFVDYLKRILDKSFDANFVESYKNVSIEIMNFQEILASYAPFINKNLNEHFENFRMYVDKKIKFIQIESEKYIKNEITEKEFIKSVCSVKFEKIEQLHENIVNNLRTYLQSLKVQED